MTMRHKWADTPARILLAHETTDGNERHERACAQCKMKRVTVVPPRGLPWHEWITVDGGKWIGEATPPCLFAPPKAVERAPLREAS